MLLNEGFDPTKPIFFFTKNPSKSYPQKIKIILSKFSKRIFLFRKTEYRINKS